MSPSTPKPAGCTNFKLRQLLRRVARLYDLELAATGLKTTQYSLLSALVKTGPIAPGQLARRSEPSSASMRLADDFGSSLTTRVSASSFCVSVSMRHPGD